MWNLELAAHPPIWEKEFLPSETWWISEYHLLAWVPTWNVPMWYLHDGLLLSWICIWTLNPVLSLHFMAMAQSLKKSRTNPWSSHSLEQKIHAHMLGGWDAWWRMSSDHSSALCTPCNGPNGDTTEVKRPAAPASPWQPRTMGNMNNPND